MTDSLAFGNWWIRGSVSPGHLTHRGRVSEDDMTRRQVLTADQRLELYNAGSKLKYPFSLEDSMTRTQPVIELEPACECGVAFEDHETCEYCGEPAHRLTEVEDRDDSVGYFHKALLCQRCEEQISR